MAKLIFNLAAVEREIAACEVATAHHKNYGKVTGPGLWLVGDRGIYLMGNQERTEKPPFAVVYAKGADPAYDDGWYENKRAWFGGDDGVEFIDLGEAKKWAGAAREQGRDTVTITLTPDELALELI